MTLYTNNPYQTDIIGACIIQPNRIIPKKEEWCTDPNQPIPDTSPEPTLNTELMFSSKSQKHLTPKHLLITVEEFFNGQIDLDPCSNSETKPNVPALVHFTENTNGLDRSWYGKVFVNPPYSRYVNEWVNKCIQEYNEGHTTEIILLVAARPDNRWFNSLQNHPWCAIKGRLKFSDAENSAPFPSALFYIGPCDRYRAFYEKFGFYGPIYKSTTFSL
ncbi:DNA N-6-adenine-methyltransferase [Bacteroides sp.]|uniref:DNA N-6-adenine-methyltransferase n=1 Tax=Bacteroides sp. TaxID=29523 RepID=UPI0026268A24|nr:DNA N-6-adenine-methyltransferase [Bacteroides sp.]MDD3040717.1 DNA N-6-adenine-methyltransferase [Bacteroides sp.]